jgi:hypothetical protein
MGIIKKPHISKTGKSVLALCQQPVIGSAVTASSKPETRLLGRRQPSSPIDLASKRIPGI